MKKIFFIVVGNHTFSRILLPKSYTFSRITPCTLYWIQKVRPQKSIIHPSNIQQKSLSLLTTKSAIRTSYKGSKPGTLDTSKAPILDSKSTATKIHHPPIKYPTKIAIFAHNQVSNKDFIQGKQTWDFGYIKSTNSAPKPGQGPHGHKT